MKFQSFDRAELFSHSATVEKPVATVLLIHGMGEHSGRYEHLFGELNAWNIDVHALDLRGHGRSPGTRGDIRSFSQFYKDIDVWISWLRIENLLKHGPTFILGHSLGGMIAYTYAAQERAEENAELFSGIILSAPGFDLPEPEKVSLQYLVAKNIPALFNTFQIPNGIDAKLLSHDSDVVSAYEADPLVHRWVTPRFFVKYRRASRKARKLTTALPTLFLIAGADQVVQNKSAIKLAKKTGAEVRIFPGFYHEIFNEVKRDKAFQVMKKWIQKQLKSASSKSSARRATGKGTSPSPRANKALSI